MFILLGIPDRSQSCLRNSGERQAGAAIPSCGIIPLSMFRFQLTGRCLRGIFKEHGFVFRTTAYRPGSLGNYAERKAESAFDR